MCGGFSTLCGSKWIGTQVVIADLPLGEQKFQYPLRVEMDWNSTMGIWPRIRASVVSVPSAGRNGLELVDNQSMVTSITPCFSTLCGSKWIGTPESASARPDTRVSVPSAGRNGLEPRPSPQSRTARSGFSTLCGSKWIGTTERLADHRGNRQVSVPSAGRNGLEPQSTQRQIIPLECFSTLCGSKWIGTCRRSDHLLPFQQVSVPSAGRNGLELNRFATSLCNLSGFQYPLRVEMDWNAAPNSHRDSHFRSFSTLCGSKWIGTSPDLSGPSASIVFQYPLRVEMDWNNKAARAERGLP